MIYLGNQAVGFNKNERVNIAEAELSSIAIRTNPANMFYSVGETFDPTGMEVVANYIVGEDNLNNVLITNYTYTTSALVAGDNTITISYTFSGVTKTTSLVVKVFAVGNTLNDTSWATISQIAQTGCGNAFWDIGDAKAVALNGQMGGSSAGITFSDLTLYVFILDFNHPEYNTVDNNIIFGGFKSALTNGVELCLYPTTTGSKTDGTLCFNMNHWGNYNYGGWAGCDLRYDILGGTETAPSGYGAAKTTSTVGYNATSTAITSPVANTLMACLPSDFRNVLRLRTHYVDNKGNASNINANVTAITDAISLLTEFEVFGLRTFANSYEKNYQHQMGYYDNGNSQIKYRHNSQSSTAYWWLASPYCYGSNSFCIVNSSGQASSYSAYNSYGVAPAFKI